MKNNRFETDQKRAGFLHRVPARSGLPAPPPYFPSARPRARDSLLLRMVVHYRGYRTQSLISIRSVGTNGRATKARAISLMKIKRNPRSLARAHRARLARDRQRDPSRIEIHTRATFLFFLSFSLSSAVIVAPTNGSGTLAAAPAIIRTSSWASERAIRVFVCACPITSLDR